MKQADSADAAGVTSAPGPPDELTDQTLAEEIELLSELVVAAAGADQVMTEPQVDEALGVSPVGDHPTRPHHGSRRARRQGSER